VSQQPPPSERRTNAWVGKALRLEGKIISREDLRIDGEVEGSIEVGGHDLTIGAEAAVKANLIARVITISGAVIGNVQASEKVDIHATGSVTGDIRTPRLAMAEGAMVTGAVDAGSKSAATRSS
jgi:cytoskeletal protein CcmA (bactofilin family)